MKITTVREIIQKDGSKTTITLEDDINGSDINQLERNLDLVGFYDSQSVFRKFLRFIRGKNNV